MRVLFFGTYRSEYDRNRLMIARLRAQGVEVTECHAQLWRGMEDREQVAARGWQRPSFWLRVIAAYASVLQQYLQAGPYDVMVVGYPGQMDIPLARLLSRLRRKPLVWDVMMSIYLIACERGLDRRSPLSVRLLQWLEGMALRMPDMLIIDTEEYLQWYQGTYGIDRRRVRLLPLGADDRVFRPPAEEQTGRPAFCCLYYGTYIPNHGTGYILEAARLLKGDPAIQFEMIGRGPELGKARALAEEYELQNITFIDWLEREELVGRIAKADVLLGTFGVTPQSMMTMQHKIHEGLAMAKPVINGDSPVMRSTLTHGRHIYLCAREDPQAIANAILALQRDPGLRDRLSDEGYRFYREHMSFERLGQKLLGYLAEVAPSTAGELAGEKGSEDGP